MLSPKSYGGNSVRQTPHEKANRLPRDNRLEGTFVNICNYSVFIVHEVAITEGLLALNNDFESFVKKVTKELKKDSCNFFLKGANLNVAAESRQKLDSRLASLMKASQAGDPVSYEMLLKEVTGLLQKYHSYSLSKMGIRDSSRADDLTQETILAIHEKRHTYQSDKPFSPWMYAIARYKLIDFGRKNKKEFAVDDLEPLTESVEPQKVTDAIIDVQSMSRTLTESQKKAILLVKIQGLTIAEASKQTGLSESAIKVQIHRAMKSLKNDYLKESFDE